MEEMNSEIINKLFEVLPTVKDLHSTQTPLYGLLKETTLKEIKNLFQNENPGAGVKMGSFGNLKFPYRKMGAIDSLDLFGLDELIIFSFYWANKDRYKKAVDIGANIGLHSLMLSKCGYKVTAYEPDPKHLDWLQQNITLNDCSQVTPVQAAVSKEPGELEFVRVLGNTTGSHLAGAKDNPYGDLERFPVKVESIKDIIKDADLLKVDAEGHETEILLATTAEDWKTTDAMLEVGTEKNAKILYDFFTGLGVNLFSQKCGWKKVEKLEDVPTGYKEGSLFISTKSEMPWN
jgi:FkbM family methyltransferase